MSDPVTGSAVVSAVMPDGTVQRIKCASRAELARAVLSFRERKGDHINVIDPWLPKREPNAKSLAKDIPLHPELQKTL